jgi:ribosomal protein L15
MSGKPRKAFDGVGRPQGFIDDAAKVLLKASKRVVNMGKKGEASMLSPMSKKKFDRIYGKGSAKQVAEQTKKNERTVVHHQNQKSYQALKAKALAQNQAAKVIQERKQLLKWIKVCQKPTLTE